MVKRSPVGKESGISGNSRVHALFHFPRIQLWWGRLNHGDHREHGELLFLPFVPSVSLCALCGFPKLYFENVKKSPGFWSPQREITRSVDDRVVTKTLNRFMATTILK